MNGALVHYGTFYFSERLIVLKYSSPGKFFYNHGIEPKILLLDNCCFRLYNNYTFMWKLLSSGTWHLLDWQTDSTVGGISASIFKVVRCFQSADFLCSNLLTDFLCMSLQVLTTVTIIIVTGYVTRCKWVPTFWANLTSPSSGYTLLPLFNIITPIHQIWL
jgi:hypothetical protein